MKVSNYILESPKKIYKFHKKGNFLKIIWIIIMSCIILGGIFITFFLDDKATQNFIQKYFGNIQKSFKDNNSVWLLLLTILNSKIAFFILFIFGYNYWTIYKSTIFLFGFIFSSFFTSLAQIIFPQNYYHSQENNINFSFLKDDICLLTGELTFPCTIAVLSCYIYPTFISFVFYRKDFHILIRFFFSLFSYVIAIGLNILLIAVNIYSLKEIVFGMTIGLSVHIIVSHIIQFRFNSSKNFLDLITTNIIFYIVVILGLFFIFIFFFIMRYLQGKISEIKNQYENKCPSYKFKNFLWESFINSCVIILILIIVTLIKYEYIYVFHGNNDEYNRAFFNLQNFSESMEVNEKVIDSLLTDIEEQNKQWNQTNCFSYIMRIIAFATFLVLLYSVDYLFDTEIEENNSKVDIFYKCSIIYDGIIKDILLIIFCYYIGKKLVIKCGLGNS
jgi:hypothetical protein